VEVEDGAVNAKRPGGPGMKYEISIPENDQNDERSFAHHIKIPQFMSALLYGHHWSGINHTLLPI
jgi:hypothetical protein